MLFEFGKFCVDVDVERTKEFYENHGKTVLEDCGCDPCRNYYKAILNAPDKVQAFFKRLESILKNPRKQPGGIPMKMVLLVMMFTFMSLAEL